MLDRSFTSSSRDIAAYTSIAFGHHGAKIRKLLVSELVLAAAFLPGTGSTDVTLHTESTGSGISVAALEGVKLIASAEANVEL